MIYHIGNLHYDREQNQAVAKIAREAWRKYRAGQVELFQKRVCDGVCEYHAVAKPKPWTAVAYQGGRKHKICGPLSS